MLSDITINNILNYWFPNEKYNKFWFDNNPNIDNYLNNEYYDILINLYDYILELTDDKLNNLTPNQLIVYIIILDQFSRNISRVNDDIDNIKINEMTNLAITLSYLWINKKLYLQEPINKNVFALMPLRHSYKLYNYKIIINVLSQINDKDKDNEIYIKFKNNTMYRYKLLL
jgi:uncharacterized protein (DUF924 family)